MMQPLHNYEVWFVTGSQHLYGDDVLDIVAEHAQEIAAGLDGSTEIPVKVVAKPVLTNAQAIKDLVLEANADKKCIGLITWMHTFSPAKMWIGGLGALQKPFVHLHTQFNRDIPWDQIDMDFMNLNQSAHGDREFGFMVTRMRLRRKVVVGHWQDGEVQREVGVWTRAAAAWQDSQQGKLVRFGDNMRNVAVTEGDKVEAEIVFGYTVQGYGVGDLAKVVADAEDAAVDELVKLYQETYKVAENLKPGGAQFEELKKSARIELGMRRFLEAGGFTAFTTNFEDLHGLPQLPGLAVQRLMADGYGFGGEGDWKTAALVRAMKVMAQGLAGGTSFMEDYTYHLDPQGPLVLGAHMLEVCESIAADTPSLEMHPLSIGDKEDPARLVFNTPDGPAINASVIDMGNRFRLVVNKVMVEDPNKELPKLPVARVLWKPLPSLKDAAAAWIYAGGAHHSGFSQAITAEHMEAFAEIAGIEMVTIDESTQVNQFQKELRWNEMYYGGFGR